MSRNLREVTTRSPGRLYEPLPYIRTVLSVPSILTVPSRYRCAVTVTRVVLPYFTVIRRLFYYNQWQPFHSCSDGRRSTTELLGEKEERKKRRWEWGGRSSGWRTASLSGSVSESLSSYAFGQRKLAYNIGELYELTSGANDPLRLAVFTDKGTILRWDEISKKGNTSSFKLIFISN